VGTFVGTPPSQYPGVISIGRVGAADAARYYLDRQAGCALDYYTGAGEPVGRWRGDGAAALDLTGSLDGAGESALRGLLSGCGVDGQPLLRPVLRADPRSRLPAEPLLMALATVGTDITVPPGVDRALNVARARIAAGQPARLGVDVIRQVTTAIDVDPVEVYRDADSTDRYTAALAHADAQVDTRRAGLDVTVSAPKSVSVLYGLADPHVAAAVKAAHQIAVGEVIGYLQRHAATAVRGHHGNGKRAARVGTDGLIVAAFDHRTSRAGDPQLHTHLVIPNLVRGVDGRWSAMDTAAIYRHSRTAASIYHAVLRGELTRALGVAWTPVVKGIAEIDGIPQDVLRGFSTRRQQITQAMTRHGVTGPRAAQAACLDTRPAKPRHDQLTLRERWTSQAHELGWETAATRQILHRHPRLAGIQVEELAAQLFGPDGVTASRTTFTRQDLARAACDLLPAGTPVRLADVDRLVALLIKHVEVIPLATRNGCDRRYTTAELLLTEHAALASATAPTHEPVGVANADQLARELTAAGLSAEQADMVTTLVTSGRRVEAVAGPAGAGKTAALATAARAWAAAGLPVRGTTLSWQAAQQLESATSIPTASIARTLHHADRHGLPDRVVLVADEASLINTRTYHRLAQHVLTVGGKLVLVGDPDQLPEIGAGGLFAHLATRPEAIRLSGNQRQTQPWEQDALRILRDGDPLRALDAYVIHGRVHAAPSRDSLLGRIARDYQRHTEVGRDVLVLAARRADTAQLNTEIRDQLIAAGRLGADELTVTTSDGPRSYRAGERVLVATNDRRRGLTNGARGTVTVVDPATGHLTAQLDDGRPVALDIDQLAAGALTHGYATTVHKAQGLTVDTTLVYGLGPLTREHGYVALSRGRAENHLYLASDAPTTAGDCIPPRLSPDRHPRSLLVELAERLRDSGQQHLAASQQIAEPFRQDDDELLRRQRYDNRDRGYGRAR
jgi:conjugative relaxase-like TrwC/TraI family protein